MPYARARPIGNTAGTRQLPAPVRRGHLRARPSHRGATHCCPCPALLAGSPKIVQPRGLPKAFDAKRLAGRKIGPTTNYRPPGRCLISLGGPLACQPSSQLAARNSTRTSQLSSRPSSTGWPSRRPVELANTKRWPIVLRHLRVASGLFSACNCTSCPRALAR